MKIYHKLVRADNPEVRKFISRFVPSGRSYALDVGCGEGYLFKLLEEKGYSVIGIDVDMEMLKLAKSRGKIIKVDVSQGLPFKDNSFNFILASDVLEHVDNPVVLMSEIHRVLRKKMNALFKIPNGWFDFAFILEDHKRLLTRDGFEKICKKVGFKIVKVGEMGIVPFIRKVINFPQYIVFLVKK